MGNKKKNTIQTTDVERTQRNMIRLNNSPITNKILTIQTQASNKIYNQDLYCRRIWYSRAYNKILSYHINHIDDNLTLFSSRDKTLIFEELIRSKDHAKINKLLSYVRSWEKQIFVGLLAKARSKIKNVVLNEPTIHKTDRINYSFSLQTIIDIINKIGLYKFRDKYGYFGDFMDLISQATAYKVANQLKTQENPNRKRDMRSKGEKKEQPENPLPKKSDGIRESQFHLIPSTTLHPDIVPHYVKKYFLLQSQKSIDKYNPYELLGSQVVQQVHKKVLKAYKGFFNKRASDKKDVRESAKPPTYRKDGRFVLVFQKTSFTIKIVNDEKFLNLSLGKTMKEKMVKLDPVSEGFLVFKLPKNLVEKDVTINEVEITPDKDRSVAFINYKYTINVPIKKERVDRKNYRTLSIDFGMTNLITAFSLFLENPLIYKGGFVMYINKMYKSLIEGLYQPGLSKTNDKNEKKNIQEQIDKFWRRREAIIKDHFNKISHDFIERCIEAKIDEIIMGYNKNWKNNVNMGNINNDKFYKVPYRSLIHMIFTKAEEKGITVIERNESYTSICDAVNWETVGYHKRYSGNRIVRGLFSSKKHVYVNADVNGAINIMRKELAEYPVQLKALKVGIKDYKRICNPVVVKIKQDQKTQNKNGTIKKKVHVLDGKKTERRVLEGLINKPKVTVGDVTLRIMNEHTHKTKGSKKLPKK